MSEYHGQAIRGAQRQIDPTLRAEPEREHRDRRAGDRHEHVRLPGPADVAGEQKSAEQASGRHGDEPEGDLDGRLRLREAREADREQREKSSPDEGQAAAEQKSPAALDVAPRPRAGRRGRA